MRSGGLHYVAAEPDGREVAPAELPDDSVPVVEDVANHHRMVAAAAVLGVVLLLVLGPVEAAHLRLADRGADRRIVLVDVRGEVCGERARLGPDPSGSDKSRLQTTVRSALLTG